MAKLKFLSAEGDESGRTRSARALPGEELQQYAALPWRMHRSVPQVMLVTTRGAGRWIVPKGWAEPRLSGAELAAKEAFEEAGIVGEPAQEALGTFRYWKQLGGRRVQCLVDVYALRVRSLLKTWPESGQRRREWLKLSEAAGRIDVPELAALLRELAARDGWCREAEVRAVSR